MLVGARALLIRGPSGAGKSALALRLLTAGSCGRFPFARLVGDDRVILTASHGRLLVRPAPALAGLLEVRGLGIRRVPFESVACVGLIVDLAAPGAERMPPTADAAILLGVRLPRLAFPPEADPFPAIGASFGTRGP